MTGTPDLTGAKLHIWGALKDDIDPIPVSLVALRTGYSVPYVTRLLAELREQGVVACRPDLEHTGRGARRTLWRLA